MTTVWAWKLFYKCSMCLHHIWYYFFAWCVLYGNWVLDEFGDYITISTNWYIQLSLDFRIWLVYTNFILKGTKLLVKLPWTSRKQSTVFSSRNWILVFLTCSILSAKADPIVCVEKVFWMELNKCFLFFFLKSLFFAMLGIVSTLLCWWLNWTALCTLSKSCPVLTTILSLNRYLKSVYRQFTCW